MADNARSSGTESAARATAVLLLFLSGQESWGVSAIAREIGLSKAVVHRLLQTFVAQGFLVRRDDTREYSLGPAVAALGAAALRSSDLRLSARPALKRLRTSTNETVTLANLIGAQRVFIDQVESRREMKITVELGKRYPLTVGSTGRVILAHLPEARRELALQEQATLPPPFAPLDPGALREDCVRIRDQGYAISQGERQSGAASVAAPVFNLDGEGLGAITICGPTSRLSQEALEEMSDGLVVEAQRVSIALGYHAGGEIIFPQ